MHNLISKFAVNWLMQIALDTAAALVSMIHQEIMSIV